MRVHVYVACLVVAVGCGDPANSPVSQDSQGDRSVAEDVGEPDSRREPLDLVAPDETDPSADVLDVAPAPDEQGQPQCEVGEGCFLDPCTENAQCQSGYCVEHMGESVCTIQCTEECQPGWSCRQIGVGPDLAFVCISEVANLCKPCSGISDCKSPGGADDVCLSYGDEGAFCGGGCVDDSDCPWGFTCTDAVTVDGIEITQCVAQAGVCPCAARSVELALWTPCSVATEWGVCDGKRVCTDEGLSSCDASQPEQEICNGLDDDCDGLTDEPDDEGGEFVPICDDGNPCSEDVCGGADGCFHTALDEGECLDGDACTIGDHCEAGVCIGSSIACDDANPCTDDSCDGLGGCQHAFNLADCDDGDPCTVADRCDEGACAGYVVPCDCQQDADCAALEDGDPCNGILFCDTNSFPYQCEIAPDSVVDCPQPQGPGSFCLASVCDSVTGGCQVVPAHEGFACDDGDPCSLGDVCGDGECAGAGQVNCADDNPCTEDFCDPQEGCVYVNNQLPCNDGDACTLGDACSQGVCVSGVLVQCDDGNVCTTDSCDGGQCLHAAVPGDCDDGDACTVNDQCVGGVCTSSGFLDCDDGTLCTTDLCDAVLGCVSSVNTLPCDDDDLCTQSDHCHLGECVGSMPLLCDDHNPCTADSCNALVGCEFVPQAGACEDGNDCTQGDACAEGTCVPGLMLDCDDGNPCTHDTCALDGGCSHEPVDAPCSDGSICTLGDLCVAGECQPGAVTLVCDDDNLCTTDSCDPGSGCVFAFNTEACDDQDACTSGDVCMDGSCQPGAPVVCPDDLDACTTESCDPIAGCLSTPVVPCCGNGDVEVGEECDDGNTTPDDGCDGQCQNEAACIDIGQDKLIMVSELNSCLEALGAAFHDVEWIEVAYGNTSYLDNVCQAFGYASYSTTHGGDMCGSSSADMYPSYCSQGWLGAACHNGCGNTNYDGFYCQ